MAAPPKTLVRMAVIALATATPGLVVVDWRDRWIVLHAESGKAILGSSFPDAASALAFAERAGEYADWCVPDWSNPAIASNDALELAELVLQMGGTHTPAPGIPALTG